MLRGVAGEDTCHGGKSQPPQLVLADELLVQFGKDVVFNTFDQNRIFIGIKQKINNSLSFDTGYMSVFQQKSNGINYIQSNTFRLFFYYTIKINILIKTCIIKFWMGRSRLL